MSAYDRCIVLTVEFQAATIAATDTRCETDKYIFRDFRDVEQVESVEKYVKKLIGCKTIRDLMITFSTEGSYYDTKEGYCRIIREYSDKIRIVKWPERNVVSDSTFDKITTKDIRQLYLATVEKLFDRFPDSVSDADAV